MDAYNNAWIAYDIPGNVGWIAYLVCVFLGLREKKDSYNIASALPGVLTCERLTSTCVRLNSTYIAGDGI